MQNDFSFPNESYYRVLLEAHSLINRALNSYHQGNRSAVVDCYSDLLDLISVQENETNYTEEEPDNTDTISNIDL